MARFSGIVGYAKSVRGSNGVSENVITKRKYYGDVLSQQAKWIPEQKINDNLIINNRISIVADSYAHANRSFLKFVEIDEVFWEVSGIETRFPRLVLTLGGVYNGPTE